MGIGEVKIIGKQIMALAVYVLVFTALLGFISKAIIDGNWIFAGILIWLLVCLRMDL